MKAFLLGTGIVGGSLAVLMASGMGDARAQPGAGGQSRPDSGGTQGVQEKLYEERMKESQESQTPTSQKPQHERAGAGTHGGQPSKGDVKGHGSDQGTQGSGDMGSGKGQPKSNPFGTH